MKGPHKCLETTKAPIVSIKENKRRAQFRNKSKDEFVIGVVDGCLIKEGPRTDYLVSKVGVASVLVELKGSDVGHACEQIFATVSHPSVSPMLEDKLGFLVICRKYPRFDSFVAKAKQRAMKQYKCGFHIVCNWGEFEIERVAAIDGPF